MVYLTSNQINEVIMNNKKHSHHFFAVVLPGLESFALLELTRKSKELEFTFSNILAVDGGISFEAEKIEDGFYANHYLKIPTRILLRIDSFIARDFPKLYNKFTKVNWNQYFPGKVPELKFSSADSVIFDSRKVEKGLSDAIKFYQIGCPPKKKESEKIWNFEPRLHIRVSDNKFTLSVDTTGERLDKRGHKLQTVHAPIRESIAAGMLEFYNQHARTKLKSLRDPMCGSASLLMEFNSYENVNYNRTFSYQNFPKVQVKKIRRENLSQFEKSIGNDIDPSAILASIENVSSMAPLIEIKEQDFFTNVFNKDELVVLNPPYNKRIKVGSNIHSFIASVVEYLAKSEVGALLIVAPETFKLPRKLEGYKRSQSSRINNGGIWVLFSLYVKV